MEALKIEMIEYKDSKILADLNMEKWIEKEEVKLEKLKIAKAIQVKKILFQRNICVSF